ncbi:hypothetical protein P7K49_005912 [Saguinus oedipus]|uniref:Uncharacterized protein n=1 Tax=Saguinus oedipus TaxID=9490 RepID=A0ABQ9W0Y1_SAGOE|nr:hypothetical protein P7K49_005912 [Saguinus oedipus]
MPGGAHLGLSQRKGEGSVGSPSLPLLRREVKRAADGLCRQVGRVSNQIIAGCFASASQGTPQVSIRVPSLPPADCAVTATSACHLAAGTQLLLGLVSVAPAAVDRSAKACGWHCPGRFADGWADSAGAWPGRQTSGQQGEFDRAEGKMMWLHPLTGGSDFPLPSPPVASCVPRLTPLGMEVLGSSSGSTRPVCDLGILHLLWAGQGPEVQPHGICEGDVWEWHLAQGLGASNIGIRSLKPPG